MKIAVVLPHGCRFSAAPQNSIARVVADFGRLSRYRDSLRVVATIAPGASTPLATIPIAWTANRRIHARRVVAALETWTPDLVEIHEQGAPAVQIARAFPTAVTCFYRHGQMKSPGSAVRRWRHLKRQGTFDAQIFVSKDARRAFLETFPPLAPRTHVLTNAIDTVAWEGDPATKTPAIAYVGRPAPEKGFPELCMALPDVLEAHPDWQIHFVLNEWDHYARTAEAALAPLAGFGERVKVLKNQPTETVRAQLREAAIAVLPSRCAEAFPLAALEAHASGTAVISSGRGGMREVSGPHALYLEEVTPEAISGALRRLIEAPETREDLARKGQAFVRRRHGLAQRAKELDDLRDDILRSGKVTRKTTRHRIGKNRDAEPGWPHGQAGSLALLRRIFRENARQHVTGYALAFLCMGLVAGATAASAWIMKDVINGIFIARNGSLIPLIALAILLIYGIKGIAGYGQQVLLSRIGNRIVARLQMRIFQRLSELDMAFYARYPMSQVTLRVTQNARAAREVINLIMTSIGRDSLTLIALMAVMILQDPWLSLAALVVLPPAVLGVVSLIRAVRRIAAAEQSSNAKIIEIVQETVLGQEVVKAFTLEDRMREGMRGAIGQLERRANRIAAINATTSPLMETLGGLAIAGVVLYGGWRVVAGGQDPGSFFSFIAAVLLAYEPAKRLARLNVNIQVGIMALRFLYQVLDSRPQVVEAEDARDLALRGGEIRLEDVSFSYGKVPALRRLTLTAAPGKVTALVGPSGAGKSTVFRLIERFYDPRRGAVTIDGQDLRSLSLRSLRENIALVGQDAFLFNGTVRENILCGRLEASAEEVREAARDANALDFIEKLPKGFETPVGQGGSALSGGQRQRIAIARAMLRNAPILLLDEATSALDSESERKVQCALARLMKGRTTLVIAHRLSTVRDADTICVLEDGELVESGSHDELLARGGRYADLYALQFRGSSQAQPHPRRQAPVGS